MEQKFGKNSINSLSHLLAKIRNNADIRKRFWKINTRPNPLIGHVGGFFVRFSCFLGIYPCFFSIFAASKRIFYEEKVFPTDNSSEFVTLTDVVPDAILEIRYYGTYNFVGQRIDGYEQPTALLTKQAAKAMLAHGFKPLDSEWWHFTLKDEPFPNTYFTFPVRQLTN